MLFNNASFFSEPVFLLLALLFLWAMDLGKERGTFAPNAAAGFLAALAFGAREYSALAVLLPAGIWWVTDVIRGRRRPVTLAYLALGAACGAAPLLLYNAAVTGAPLRFPRVYTSKVHLGLDAEFVRHYMAYITTRRLWVFVTDVAGWPLVSLMPALLPLFFRDLPRTVRLLYFVGLLAVLQFVVGQHLGLDYGARYYYPALPAVFLGGAWGWMTLARRLAAPGRWPPGTAAAAGVLLVAGATVPYFVALEPVYRDRWAFPDNARPWVTPELAHALAVLNVRDALVFVSPPERCDGPPPNDAELRHRLLFARDRGPRNREFAQLYPRARYLRCSYGLFEQTGYLEELTFYNLQPAGRKRP